MLHVPGVGGEREKDVQKRQVPALWGVELSGWQMGAGDAAEPGTRWRERVSRPWGPSRRRGALASLNTQSTFSAQIF